MVTVKNKANYDRKFIGMEQVIKSGQNLIPEETVELLNKNCINFQQMLQPPDGGGEPFIGIGRRTDDGKIKVFGKQLEKPTLFTAPTVLLYANDTTEVPKDKFEKLCEDERFKRLVRANQIKIDGYKAVGDGRDIKIVKE